MGRKRILSIRMDEELLAKIDARGMSRTDFVVEAVIARLNGPELGKAEQRAVLNAGKSLSDMMRDAMVERMQKERDLLDGLSREDFLKLVAGRLPKEDIGDADLDREVLSLGGALEALPSVEDVTRELNHAKGEVNKLKYELDVERRKVGVLRGGEKVNELVKSVYEGAVRYCVDLCIRRSLPCVGDGGGLSDAGMADVGREVEGVLKSLGVSGDKSR